MSKTVKAVLDATQEGLLKRAVEDLHAKQLTRAKKPEPWLVSVRDFCRCRWYKDLGHDTWGDFAVTMWPHENKSHWLGWEALSELAHIIDLYPLIRARRLQVSRLAALRGVLNEDSYRTWITLALTLSYRQLEAAVLAFHDIQRSGTRGPLVFVPLWVPEREYKEHFDEETPPWRTLKERLEEASIHRRGA